MFNKIKLKIIEKRRERCYKERRKTIERLGLEKPDRTELEKEVQEYREYLQKRMDNNEDLFV